MLTHYPYGHPFSCGKTFGELTTLTPYEVTCPFCIGESRDNPSVAAEAIAALAAFGCTDRANAETLLSMWARRSELSEGERLQVLGRFPEIRHEATDLEAEIGHAVDEEKPVAPGPQVKARDAAASTDTEQIQHACVEFDAHGEHLAERVRAHIEEGRWDEMIEAAKALHAHATRRRPGWSR